MIENAKIASSVVGVRSIIRDGSHLSRVVLHGRRHLRNRDKRVAVSAWARTATSATRLSTGRLHRDGAVLINKDSIVNGEKDASYQGRHHYRAQGRHVPPRLCYKS